MQTIPLLLTKNCINTADMENTSTADADNTDAADLFYTARGFCFELLDNFWDYWD